MGSPKDYFKDGLGLPGYYNVNLQFMKAEGPQTVTDAGCGGSIAWSLRIVVGLSGLFLVSQESIAVYTEQLQVSKEKAFALKPSYF